MQNNPEIEQIIENAVRIAREKQHAYVLTDALVDRHCCGIYHSVIY